MKRRWFVAVVTCCTVAMPPTSYARADTSATSCHAEGGPVAVYTEPPIAAAQALAPRVLPTRIVVEKDGIVRAQFSGQSELAYHLLRARYFDQQHDVTRSIDEYRLAVATAPGPGEQPSYHDSVTRLPLSVVLYRAGRIAEARSEWRTMLAGARKDQYPVLPHPPSVELLGQRRLDLLAEREVPRELPDWVENGAGRYIVRGMTAAKQRRDADAVAAWRCAATISPAFELSHLLLGYAAALRGNEVVAKQEWIAALEGAQRGPGDMFGITAWKYDAMEALLRFT